MLHYILQSVLFQLVFLLVYELFLKQETFFSYNRIYLLLTPVIALLLPLLNIPLLQNAIFAENFIQLPEVFIGNLSAETLPIAAKNASDPSLFETINWWFVVYGAGLLASFAIFINKFRVLRTLFAHPKVFQQKNFSIVEIPNSTIACTFYNTVFIGAQVGKKEREQIISHEKVHVRQKHTLDLLFFELLKVLFWFNPLIYIYQNRISALHEFQADAGVVKNVEKQTYYQQLLNSVFNTEDISFINQFFNHSIIKKRIVMLQKSKSKTVSKLKFLIVLPLMLFMLTYVACSEEQINTPVEKEASATEKIEEIKAIVNGNSNISQEDSERIKEILNTVTLEDMKSGSGITRKVETQKFDGNGDVPFAIIEEVPAFPGCENAATNQEKKDCTTQNINQFVNKEFNTGLGEDLGLKGINRIYVQFKITSEGKVEVMGARAPHPALEAEATRVVNMLPQMSPGKHKGKEVSVLYSLPIAFKINE